MPAVLPDDHSLTDGLRVRDELQIERSPPVTRFVEPINQIPGLLKLDGEEIGRRCFDPLLRNALLIRAARGNVGGPEIPTRNVGCAVKKVQIVLPDVELRIINRIGKGRSGWVFNRQRGGAL